ncbi:protein-tyrosine phosphatase family protein [Paenibacillus timonensis]|uniref:protein-tyrosine phosphatase family protein n=1 Tax=Paenibacillus timonensis TaxID=225915 RepID=UPI003F9BBCE1
MAHYHELVKGKVFIGGIDGLQEALRNEDITDVYDIRDDGKEPNDFPKSVMRHHYPIVEDTSGQETSIAEAIQAIKQGLDHDQKVYFHCSGGRNRTGTVATGLMLELGQASSVAEAESLVKSIRSEIAIKPEMRDALRTLYSNRN